MADLRPTTVVSRFFQSYGRIYDIVDPTTLATDLYQAFSAPVETRHYYATALDSIYILRILIVTALGMQMSEPHRLHGRGLGRIVEDFIIRASRVCKPCIGSVQVLLLLLLLKTVMASDIDEEHDSVSFFGLEWTLGDREQEDDAQFNYASARLANMVAPVHQISCSTKPFVTAERQKALQSDFASLVSELPPSLQSGTSVADPVAKLQRALFFVGMQSYLLVLSLSSILRNTTDELVASGDFSKQRPQLLETWDNTASILNQFEGLCKRPQTPTEATDMGESDASTIAHHLMWADAGRAALTGCLVVGRLRRHDIDKAMPFSNFSQQQHSTVLFQSVLANFLSVLLEIWRSKSHLGPVTAKSSMVIAVAIAVTNNLYTNYDGIFDRGVEAANQLIVEMKSSLDQRLSQRDATARIRDSGISMDDAAAAAAASASVTQASSSVSSPQELQPQANVNTTVPLPSIASTVPGIPTSIPASVFAQQQHYPLQSARLWPPPLMFDDQLFPVQSTDLSVAGSSTGSQTTTPDFNGNAGFSGMDFDPNMSFPYAMASGFDTGSASMGGFETLFDFTCDTVINTF